MSKKKQEIVIPKKVYIISFSSIFVVAFLLPLLIYLFWYPHKELLVTVPIIVGVLVFLVWNFYGVSELKAEYKKKKDFDFDLTKKIKRLLLLLMLFCAVIALIMGLIVIPTIN